MHEIPEEVRMIAQLFGESQQIDSMMTERNGQLVTDSNTIKKGLNEYIQLSRSNPHLGSIPPSEPVMGSPMEYTMNESAPYIPPSIPSQIQYTPVVQQNPSPQLEFNLDPTQQEITNNYLKDISSTLTKIYRLLQSANDAKPSHQKDGISKIPDELIKTK